jgi:hypothetical protein
VILDRWANTPLRTLDGKTPQSAARDPVYHKRILASILLLETSGDSVSDTFDFNELRSNLSLPTLGPIDPKQHSINELPLVRLGRVEISKLSDDELILAFQRAQHYRHVVGIRKFGLELVSRASLEGKIDKADVYGQLAQIEPEATAALDYIQKARDLSVKAGRSCAPWDIAELTLRIARQDLQDAQSLMMHIQQNHLREPGVAQAFMHVLVDAGILNSDGTMASLPGETAPGIVVPGGAPAAGGSKIWTPGDPAPSAGGGGTKKSAIWTPD